MMPMGPLDNTDFDIMRFQRSTNDRRSYYSLPAALTTNTVTPTTGATVALSARRSHDEYDHFTINGAQFDEGVINFQVEQDSVLI